MASDRRKYKQKKVGPPQSLKMVRMRVFVCDVHVTKAGVTNIGAPPLPTRVLNTPCLPSFMMARHSSSSSSSHTEVTVSARPFVAG